MRGRLTVAAFHEPNDDSDARKWRHGKLADSFVYGDNTACRKNEYEIFVEIFFLLEMLKMLVGVNAAVSSNFEHMVILSFNKLFENLSDINERAILVSVLT